MEKRSPLHYIGLLVLALVTIVTFSAGNLLFMYYIERSGVREWLSLLGSFTFLAGYFARINIKPYPYSLKQFLIVFPLNLLWPIAVIIGVLQPDNPMSLLLISGANYFAAGTFFAWALERLRLATKP